MPDGTLTEAELIRELADTEVYLYGGDEEATAPVIESSVALRLIAFYGVGYESFMDVEAVRRHGVRVTNTPGTLNNSVAEFTIGQLLNCRRHLTEYALKYLNGSSGDEAKQSDLGAHTVGIIGMGGIGTRLAEILTKGFDANVAYFSRTRKPALEEQLGIRYTSLNELFEVSESLLVMIPGNSETRHLVGEEQLGRLRHGSVLVNTARPEIVEPGSLDANLRSGRISAAAIDGYYSEKTEETESLKQLQPHPLLITGHVASLTHDARDAMTRRAVGSILNFLDTGADECIVV
ncbi:hypothetical protein AFR_13875 [Actinoplanes friuliensis DSM 7358]|uniref:Uncharacterized protein n=1 Tax=Actinoplanes friuliensis DSM 7358 TaxID=1246995 RepID=U5VZJ3_9ACTN|nr:hypothetical protein AFR_13875 [Actinoplanes friuliensis DSM 7358]